MSELDGFYYSRYVGIMFCHIPSAFRQWGDFLIKGHESWLAADARYNPVALRYSQRQRLTLLLNTDTKKMWPINRVHTELGWERRGAWTWTNVETNIKTWNIKQPKKGDWRISWRSNLFCWGVQQLGDIKIRKQLHLWPCWRAKLYLKNFLSNFRLLVILY